MGILSFFMGEPDEEVQTPWLLYTIHATMSSCIALYQVLSGKVPVPVINTIEPGTHKGVPGSLCGCQENEKYKFYKIGKKPLDSIRKE